MKDEHHNIEYYEKYLDEENEVVYHLPNYKVMRLLDDIEALKSEVRCYVESEAGEDL